MGYVLVGAGLFVGSGKLVGCRKLVGFRAHMLEPVQVSLAHIMFWKAVSTCGFWFRGDSTLRTRPSVGSIGTNIPFGYCRVLGGGRFLMSEASL